MPDVTLDTGSLTAWAARCHSLAVACRQVAARVADGEAADELKGQITEVGGLLPEVDR